MASEQVQQDKVIPVLPTLNQLSQADLTQLMYSNVHDSNGQLQMMNANPWGLLEQQMLSLYAGHQMLTPNMGQMLAMYPGMQQIQQIPQPQQMQQMPQMQQMQQMPQMQQMAQMQQLPQMPQLQQMQQMPQLSSLPVPMFFMPQFSCSSTASAAEIATTNNNNEQDLVDKLKRITEEHQKLLAEIEKRKNNCNNDKEIIEKRNDRTDHKVTVVESENPDKNDKEDQKVKRIVRVLENDQSNEEQDIRNALLKYLRLTGECMISSLINNEYLERHGLPLTIGSFIRKIGLIEFEKYCRNSGIFEFHAMKDHRGILKNNSYISLLNDYNNKSRNVEARDSRTIIMNTKDDHKSKEICYFYKYATCKHGNHCKDIHSQKDSSSSVRSRSPSYDRSTKRDRRTRSRSPSYNRSSKRERRTRSRSPSYDRSSKRERRTRSRSPSYDRSAKRQTPSVHFNDWYCGNVNCHNHNRGFNFGFRKNCGKCNEPRNSQRRSRSRSRSGSL